MLHVYSQEIYELCHGALPNAKVGFVVEEAQVFVYIDDTAEDVPVFIGDTAELLKPIEEQNIFFVTHAIPKYESYEADDGLYFDVPVEGEYEPLFSVAYSRLVGKNTYAIELAPVEQGWDDTLPF